MSLERIRVKAVLILHCMGEMPETDWNISTRVQFFSFDGTLVCFC